MTATLSSGTGSPGTAGTSVFLLPDLGEGLTEAEVLQWRVAVGDVVEVDQVVVEVETAKAAVEVPCPYAGRVAALHAAVGEQVPVGRPLLTVEPLPDGPVELLPEGSVEPLPDGSGEPEPAAHAAYREEERAGSGNVLIGYGTGHGGVRRRRRRAGAVQARAAAPTAAADGPAAVGRAAEGPAAEGRAAEGRAAEGRAAEGPAASRFISPIVRRLARERGLDVAALRGSGPGGVIRRSDVEAAARQAAAPRPPEVPAVAPSEGSARTSVDQGAASSPVAAGVGPDGGAGPDGELRIPLRGVRRAVAERVSRSRREIPDVTVWVDVDATGLLEARKAIAAAHPDEPVSLLALLARIAVHALTRFPELNARVEGDEIVQSRAVHLGIAAQTDRGLLVPVVRDAHRMTTLDLARELEGTTRAARAGSLPPARLTGGTFTLNNYGVFGVDGSTPILNHPEAALLGVGRITDKPWAHEGGLALRKVGQLSLTFDHRVCDGGVAGGYLRYVADCVEQPALLLARL